MRGKRAKARNEDARTATERRGRVTPNWKLNNVIVSVATDFARFGRTLNRLEREQLPYAAALALNSTVRIVRDTLTRELPSIFDAKGAPPTPFTMRAIGTSAARKSNLAAQVFVKDQQAKYLRIEETGGIRVAKPGSPVLIPVDVARNAYGNIPRGLVRKLLADPESYFIGRTRGVYGLWERVGGTGAGGHALRGQRGLRLLVAFRERASYRPRFGFGERVRRVATANFLPALQAGLGRAMATSTQH